MSTATQTADAAFDEPILFTDSAAAKVADLIAEEGNPDLKLRVFVQGGGCSGFQYGFTFDDAPKDDDKLFEREGADVHCRVPISMVQATLGGNVSRSNSYDDDRRYDKRGKHHRHRHHD